MGSTLLIDCNTAIPAPLIWGGDALGIVLMLSGLAAALVLATFVLRARLRPVIRSLPVPKPVRRAARLRRAAA